MRLFELINRTPNAHGDVLIAFRGDYWIASYDVDNVDKKVFYEISQKTGMDVEDVMDAWPYLTSERPDIISGDIENGILTIESSIDSHHPVTSNMLMKIKKELGLKGIQVRNPPDINYDEETEFHGHDMKGKLPDVLYHGTNSRALWNIARLGLRPNSGSNWEKAGIKHDDLIFGTTNFSTAVFHANNSLGIQDDSGHIDMDDDFPVVIQFTVPDKNKLHPDYDVANQTMGSTPYADNLGYTSMNNYGNMNVSDVADANPEGRHWKNTAAFAYQGRVPAKFITRVYTNFFDPPYMNSNPFFSGSLHDFFETYDELTHYDEDEE